jgi:hypothetical protein
VALLLAPASASAFEVGLGVEGVGTLMDAPNLSSAQISGGAGLLLEERWDVAPLEWTLWQDVQLPYDVGFGFGSSSASFLPDDLGLRLGFHAGSTRPYLGVLIDASFPTSGGGTTFVGLGADLGLDIPVGAFRFGIEARAFWNVTAYDDENGHLPCNSFGCGATPSSGPATVAQVLLSVRYAFRL